MSSPCDEARLPLRRVPFHGNCLQRKLGSFTAVTAESYARLATAGERLQIKGLLYDDRMPGFDISEWEVWDVGRLQAPGSISAREFRAWVRCVLPAPSCMLA